MPAFRSRSRCHRCLTGGLPAIMVLLGLALTHQTARADMGMSMPPGMMMAENKPQDLTGLSLDELLNLDVIPVDVTGTHTHLSHEIMLGVRQMTMHWNGNREGGHNVSVADVLSRYPVAHRDMTMHMTMFDVMYAPSDNTTLMVMLPYESMSMEHVNRAGVQYPTHSSGFGDLSVSGNYTFLGNIRRGGDRWLLNAGLSIPTGSINKVYDTPTRRNAPLEYPMQLGSGTYDLTPGVTYLGGVRNWAWGAQLMSRNHLGTNRAHYRFGDEYHLNAWGYYRLNDWVGPTLRLEYTSVGRIHGADPRLDPTTNPAFDPRQQGGNWIDLIAGLEVYAPRGHLKGNRLTVEYGRPLYQHLNGLQLRNDWQWTLGYSNTFRP